eukprot:CAMPEP_0172698846 /NCGR_PEP_ID=MMETSP1074-20121228/29760_1 /TAXON_ID=2916 /ORGANISM="Ceratium fusus, Strain PA161109" /LENGTH=104 /DNA_ID=CAMNT_0013519941 /DNA_START=341 /DNA_END=652 /DNA_ORIENTATION=-
MACCTDTSGATPTWRVVWASIALLIGKCLATTHGLTTTNRAHGGDTANTWGTTSTSPAAAPKPWRWQGHTATRLHNPHAVQALRIFKRQSASPYIPGARPALAP